MPVKKLFSPIGCILSILFSAIILTVGFLKLNFLLLPFFAVKLTVCVLNLLLIVGVASFIPTLIKKLGVPAFTAFTIVTAIYTVMQFTGLMIFFLSESIESYVIYQLIGVFLYLFLALPICSLGIRSTKNN